MNNLARRLAYLGYYFRKLDWQRLSKFMAFVQHEKGWSRSQQWRRMVRDSLRFNISILEYYQFRFFDLTDAEKATWAGTGTMYEFQRRANPPTSRGLLNDKRRFYLAYRQFFRHELHTLAVLQSSPVIIENLLSRNQQLVFKAATGNCGKNVSIQSVADWTPQQLLANMEQGGFDLVETFVHQHPALQALSPSGVNTVRIFTQITGSGAYQILGCRLRISVNSPVDNMAAGNMAAPIDAETGVVNGPGVFSDITRKPAAVHPVTGCSIIGFQVPFWQETLAMIREASLLHPENRSIGWDVVITEQGPGLIEGNHDWCKLVWQLPVNQGLRHLLDTSS
jgi:hypothetical protein